MSGLSTGTAYCKIKVKMWCSNIRIGFLPWFFSGTVDAHSKFSQNDESVFVFFAEEENILNGEYIHTFWHAYFSLVPANLLPSGRVLE